MRPLVWIARPGPVCRHLFRSPNSSSLDDAEAQVRRRTRLDYLDGLELDVLSAQVLDHPGAAPEQHRNGATGALAPGPPGRLEFAYLRPGTARVVAAVGVGLRVLERAPDAVRH